jgi:hypothetical protein
MATACDSANKLVTTGDDGEIEIGDLMHQYVDGDYVAYKHYLNKDGYTPVMFLTVKDGIINRVGFDYYRDDLSKLSEDKSPELEESIAALVSERKKLNTSLLQKQASTMKTNETNPINSDYYQLVGRLMMNLSSGDTEPVVIEVKSEYTEESESADDTGSFYRLKVAYFSDDEVQRHIDFKFIDEKGVELDTNDDFLIEFEQTYQIPYKSLIERFNVSIGPTIIKEPPTEESALALVPFYDAYNQLAEKIEALHKPFEPDLQALFSSR